MPTATEIERMVVRLTGENTGYQKMLRESYQQTDKFQRDVNGKLRDMRGRFVREFNQMDNSLDLTTSKLERGAAVTESTRSAIERYSFSTRELSNLHKVGAINQTTFSRATAQAAKDYARATNYLTPIGNQIRSVGQRLTFMATVPIVGVGVAAARAFGSFDKAMVESTSIMKVTESQIADMREQALGLSANTAQGPDELARSYFYLASAGKDAEQSMSLLPQVADFATAGAFDMARATDLLTDAQSALGLSSKDTAEDTKNLTRVADVLVKANTLANGSVEQFSESLTNTAGASLRAFGKDIEEGVALLAAYADQGVKGQVAGTNLSRIMLLLSKSARDEAKAHEQLGFKVFDAQGKMRNFADIVQNLEQVTAGMSDEMKAATLETLGFEARIQQAILPLLGTSEAIRKYEEALYKAGGTTKDVAEKQMQAFSNQLKKFRNVLRLAFIDIGQGLIPAIKSMTGYVTSAAQWWRGLSKSMQQQILIVAGLVAAMGPLLIISGTLISTTGTIIQAVKLASISLGFYTAETVTATAATGSMSIGTKLLNSALLLVRGGYSKAAIAAGLYKAAVGGVAIAVITVVAPAIYRASEAIQEYNEAMEQAAKLNQDIADRFTKATDQILIDASKLGKDAKNELLKSELESSQKNLEGIKASIKGAKKAIEENDSWYKRATGNKVLEEQRTELKNQERMLELAKDRIKAIMKELDPASASAGPGSPDAAVAAALGDLNMSDEDKATISAQDKLQSRIDRLSESMQLEAESFDMASGAAKRYRDIQKLIADGADSAQIAALQAADAKLTALEQEKEAIEAAEKAQKKAADAQKKLTEEGQQLIEKHLTPLQKLQKEYEHLNMLKNAKVIDEGTFQKAKDAAEDDFKKGKDGLELKKQDRGQSPFVPKVNEEQKQFLLAQSALRPGKSNEEKVVDALQQLVAATKKNTDQNKRIALENPLRKIKPVKVGT